MIMNLTTSPAVGNTESPVLQAGPLNPVFGNMLEQMALANLEEVDVQQPLPQVSVICSPSPDAVLDEADDAEMIVMDLKDHGVAFAASALNGAVLSTALIGDEAFGAGVSLNGSSSSSVVLSSKKTVDGLEHQFCDEENGGPDGGVSGSLTAGTARLVSSRQGALFTDSRVVSGVVGPELKTSAGEAKLPGATGETESAEIADESEGVRAAEQDKHTIKPQNAESGRARMHEAVPAAERPESARLLSSGMTKAEPSAAVMNGGRETSSPGGEAVQAEAGSFAAQSRSAVVVELPARETVRSTVEVNNPVGAGVHNALRSGDVNPADIMAVNRRASADGSHAEVPDQSDVGSSGAVAEKVAGLKGDVQEKDLQIQLGARETPGPAASESGQNAKNDGALVQSGKRQAVSADPEYMSDQKDGQQASGEPGESGREPAKAFRAAEVRTVSGQFLKQPFSSIRPPEPVRSQDADASEDMDGAALSDQHKSQDADGEVVWHARVNPFIRQTENKQPGMLSLSRTRDLTLHEAGGVQSEGRFAARGGSVVQAGAEGMSLSERVVRVSDVASYFDKYVAIAMDKPAGMLSIGLHPQNLGRITLNCREDGGSINVDVVVENNYVRGYLASHESQLREVAAGSGLNISQFNVRTDADSQRGDRDAWAQGYREERDDRPAKMKEERPKVTPLGWKKVLFVA